MAAIAAAPATFDPDKFRQTTRAQWESAAEAWNRWGPLVGRWLGAATEAMLDMARVEQGSRVLDVAAGAGEQTLLAARRVGPSGHVLATDISPTILRYAAASAHREGLGNVETRELDGERHDALPAGSFDAAVSRVGLIYFPDQQRALRGIRHALREGGRFAAVVYSTPDRNPFFALPVGIIRRRGAGGRPGAGRFPRHRGAPRRLPGEDAYRRRVRALRARVVRRAAPDDGLAFRARARRHVEGDRGHARPVRDRGGFHRPLRDAGGSRNPMNRRGREQRAAGPAYSLTAPVIPAT
jgi:SAM-dependent methyltransferase